jgi:hypothetical protein
MRIRRDARASRQLPIERNASFVCEFLPLLRDEKSSRRRAAPRLRSIRRAAADSNK